MSTAYELACGCIDRTERGGVRVTLWKEHNVYHVRAHSFAEHRRISWKSFASCRCGGRRIDGRSGS